VLGSRKLLRNLRIARHNKRREMLLHYDGLLELHQFEHLRAVTGSGVGGGSHIFTSILEEPSKDFFNNAFPADINGQEMRPYFDRIRDVLRPAPVPVTPPKDRVFETAIRQAGLPEPEYPDLSIAWNDDPKHPEPVTNAAGIQQYTSTYQSDVFIGCEDGSKTTLDLTYVPIALQNDAELRPLCDVFAVEQKQSDPSEYCVYYTDHRTGEKRSETAPRLILAAGSLNTQRLLFNARDDHKGLSDLPATLGKQFSPNADLAVLLWKTAVLKDSSYGPSFGAFSRIKANGEHRFLLGEVGTIPQALSAPEFIRNWLRRSTFLFCMGRDRSKGSMNFDGHGLVTDTGRSIDPTLYDEMEEAVERVAKSYKPKRVLSNLLSGKDRNNLFTVHPLGGCSMGSGPDTGFTDHKGEVFGYPGLFVADGSLYPRSPGIGPSMTIAALAERQAELMD
jgi:cholesterol oxidase